MSLYHGSNSHHSTIAKMWSYGYSQNFRRDSVYYLKSVHIHDDLIIRIRLLYMYMYMYMYSLMS